MGSDLRVLSAIEFFAFEIFCVGHVESVKRVTESDLLLVQKYDVWVVARTRIFCLKVFRERHA